MSWTRGALCLLLLLAAPALHGAEVTTSVSEGLLSTPKINFAMTNNDAGLIYNSAELRLQATIGEVLSAIFANNPSVSGMSTADLISGGFVSGSIQPTEAGFSGWNNSFNPSSAVVSFSHGPFGFTTWQNTLSNPAQDTMVFTLNLGKSTATDPRLKNLLDFNGNGNGLVDPAERLLTLPPLTAAPDEASAGFVGIVDAFNSYTGAVNRFAVAGAWLERARAAAVHGVQRCHAELAGPARPELHAANQPHPHLQPRRLDPAEHPAAPRHPRPRTGPYGLHPQRCLHGDATLLPAGDRGAAVTKSPWTSSARLTDYQTASSAPVCRPR